MRRLTMFAAALAFAGAAFAVDLGPLHISHPSAGPTAPGQPNGAAYLTIENAGPNADRLIALQTPAAAAAELHAMSDEGGVMTMRKQGAVEIAPGATLALQQGGLHIMLIGLTSPLTAGETVPLTLTFEKAGPVTIDLVIEKPAAHDAHEGHGGGHSH